MPGAKSGGAIYRRSSGPPWQPLGWVQLGLHLAALADLRRRPRDELNGSKPMWVALSFVNLIGPLASFAFGRKR